MRRILIAAALAAFLPIGAFAGGLLTEPQARAKAVAILTGDPYGTTPEQVGRTITEVRFAQDGMTKACGAKRTAAWEFHIVVVTPNKDLYDNGVIDGYLALDARRGKLLCANLPMLD